MILIHLLEKLWENFLLLVEHRDDGSHRVWISDIAVPHEFLELLFGLINASEGARVAIVIGNIEDDCWLRLHLINDRSQMISDADKPLFAEDFVVGNVVYQLFGPGRYLIIDFLRGLCPL